jgi:hypothetical protein
MAKYLMLWSMNKNLMPADPKERGGGWGLLMEMVKNDMQKGVIKDWGVFTSQGAGYCVMQGTNVEVMKATEQYVPYVFFEPHPIATADETLELIQHLSK